MTHIEFDSYISFCLFIYHDFYVFDRFMELTNGHSGIENEGVEFSIVHRVKISFTHIVKVLF